MKIPTPKRRALVIKQFISLAQACHEMNNYNTLLEITAGLNLVPIRRLRKTWRVSILQILLEYSVLTKSTLACTKEVH